MREVPRSDVNIVLGTAHATASLGKMSAIGTVVPAEPPDVMSRLDALEKNYQALSATLTRHHDEAEERFQKYASELEAERTKRAEEDHTLRSALRETATGGLDFAIYGIIIGIVAIAYSSFAHQIALYMGGETAESACTQIVVQPALPRTPLIADARLART